MLIDTRSTLAQITGGVNATVSRTDRHRRLSHAPVFSTTFLHHSDG
jgi:hypothetical protein